MAKKDDELEIVGKTKAVFELLGEYEYESALPSEV